MRMIALAQEWVGRGGKAVFATAECPESLVSRILSENFDHHTIEATPGSQMDANWTSGVAVKCNCSWTVIDGYQFKYDFQRQVRSSTRPLLVVDDYQYEEKWFADAILNQNLFAESWSCSSEVPSARFLLGPQFALLRKELVDHSPRTLSNTFREPVRLLVTLGGGDAAIVAGTLVEILHSMETALLQIHLIAGSASANHKGLERIAADCRHNIELFHDVKDMSEQYMWADAVISNAGSSCWEWLYFQRPGAVVRMADNQQPVADELVKRGLAVDLGWHSELASKSNIKQLLSDFLQRENLSRRRDLLRSREDNQPATRNIIASESGIIDGLGAKRVCDVLAG